MIRLGINVDHVATLRQARREHYPDPVQAAALAELGGADNITCHLREDRRHIRDRDPFALKDTVNIPLNFEMAATSEMIDIAKRLKPHSVTLVPEKREELTTEGGLDVAGQKDGLKEAVAALERAGILVALFIEADERMIKLSKEVGAKAVEFHTGTFCHQMDAATATAEKAELLRPLQTAAETAHKQSLQVHFGHGLHYANASWLQHIPHAEEANIGHAVVARAIFVGMKEAVAEMKALLNDPAHRPYL